MIAFYLFFSTLTIGASIYLSVFFFYPLTVFPFLLFLIHCFLTGKPIGFHVVVLLGLFVLDVATPFFGVHLVAACALYAGLLLVRATLTRQTAYSVFASYAIALMLAWIVGQLYSRVVGVFFFAASPSFFPTHTLIKESVVIALFIVCGALLAGSKRFYHLLRT